MLETTGNAAGGEAALRRRRWKGALLAYARRTIPTSVQARLPFREALFGFYSAKMADAIEPRIRVIVAGRVQGVGYRAWVLRRALELGLRGWVRNCRDGSVEVEAAGPIPALERLRQLLADGPPLAHVLRFEEEVPYRDQLPDGFEIR